MVRIQANAGEKHLKPQSVIRPTDSKIQNPESRRSEVLKSKIKSLYAIIVSLSASWFPRHLDVARHAFDADAANLLETII